MIIITGCWGNLLGVKGKGELRGRVVGEMGSLGKNREYRIK